MDSGGANLSPSARERAAIENEKRLQDPFFASRLEKMSKLSWNQKQYDNEYALINHKKKTSLYDY